MTSHNATSEQSELRELVCPEELGRLLADSLQDPAWQDMTWTLITGGKSNLTFELTSASGQLVLRRPPRGPLLPRAHDMGREVRVLHALANTTVPVPEVVVQDTTSSTIGAPFYVMEKVSGHVLRDEMPDDYALANELAVRMPESPPPAVVHGDFRLDNCLMSRNEPSTVAAVLDWELSTLGDPLTDVGLLLFYWREVGEAQRLLSPTVTTLPGFPARDHLVDRYVAHTGRNVDAIHFYEAFAHFKFAVIAQGIAARVAGGAMAGQDFGDLSDEIIRIAEEGLAIIGRSA
ncbi:phosphotransferase family protein [Saccharopolyspora mangrovi]|uniref:Phosphotransferase family protein n=1 Tax=Saccharopolyspora mangrovi TaxID=3082379 RepID=A0ABU6A591_9PSEU|nr:phosphotransferase family protein [Saccharopolyspora sp. S2-29]MEB3366617.1 phosphotransferase family protein [Saccharopolyspora sp. S2-29]